MKKSSNYLRAISLLLLAPAIACAQTADEKKSSDSEKTGSVQIKHFKEPVKHSVKPGDLPSPFSSKSVARVSKLVPQPENAILNMPQGFQIGVFAEGEFKNPRMMAQAPNGDVFVSDSADNKILILRDKNGDGRADERFLFTEDVVQPFGLAFFKDWLYIANTNSVFRFRYASGQTKALDQGEKIIDLPGLGYRQHWTRNLIFSPDGEKLYVTVGSKTNVEVPEDPRRAAISMYDIDGKNHRIFASGLRNPIGLAFNPANGELWSAVNERDRLGDDLVPDYLTSVKDGGFYGWPYSYIGKNIDPRRKDDVKPDLVERALVPDVLVTSHSAALGLVFYSGNMFPEEYRGDVFAAFHGSWNREKLTGYKIVRVRFDKDGKPDGDGYEDFITGWLPEPSGNEVWGRPVGLLVLADGSMLITDDGAKKIWRVTYLKGK